MGLLVIFLPDFFAPFLIPFIIFSFFLGENFFPVFFSSDFSTAQGFTLGLIDIPFFFASAMISKTLPKREAPSLIKVGLAFTVLLSLSTSFFLFEEETWIMCEVEHFFKPVRFHGD